MFRRLPVGLLCAALVAFSPVLSLRAQPSSLDGSGGEPPNPAAASADAAASARLAQRAASPRSTPPVAAPRSNPPSRGGERGTGSIASGAALPDGLDLRLQRLEMQMVELLNLMRENAVPVGAVAAPAPVFSSPGVLLVMDAEGVTLNGRRIALAQLADVLRARPAGADTLTLRADAAVPVAAVLQALQLAQVAGMTTTQVDNAPPPAGPAAPSPGARRVNILGKVYLPGRYTFRPDEVLTLVNAVAAAGGPSPLAAAEIVITRRHADGKSEQIRKNLKAALNDANKDFPLQDGDTVLVPESWIGSVY